VAVPAEVIRTEVAHIVPRLKQVDQIKAAWDSAIAGHTQVAHMKVGLHFAVAYAVGVRMQLNCIKVGRTGVVNLIDFEQVIADTIYKIILLIIKWQFAFSKELLQFSKAKLIKK